MREDLVGTGIPSGIGEERARGADVPGCPDVVLRAICKKDPVDALLGNPGFFERILAGRDRGINGYLHGFQRRSYVHVRSRAR
jgi:hypothetical protein